MSLTSLILTASEAHSEPAVSPWVVGGVALGVMLAMLLALMAFGAGREHS